MKYKTLIITLCFNEMDILPFVEQYWRRIATKVLVLDNGSTDGSIEYLSQLPYVEVRHFDSEGQNDVIQKTIKEHAYLEFKDQYDIIIISDMDEVFWFDNKKQMEVMFDLMLENDYDVMTAELFALCEDKKPRYKSDKLLHQLCHKFYKQRLNHMQGFEGFSKLSIFNCHTVKEIQMSVGQHYVQTIPRVMPKEPHQAAMKILWTVTPRCLHIDKGFGLQYKWNIRQKMYKNLSEVNKRGGMGIEYAMSFEELKKEYENNQSKSFDINE